MSDYREIYARLSAVSVRFFSGVFAEMSISL